MYENSGLAIEYSFNSDSTSSYLVLNFINDYKILNHQVEIICQNPSSAFVPFHIRREDEEVSIYYNITSKISLSQYLERKTLGKKELLDLLRDITKSLTLHGNYFLDLSGFIIDLDFIYINPATAEVSLVYIPIPYERDTMKIYSAFLKDLAVNSANVDDSANDNYLQRILSYLKADSFSLNDFNRLLIDLRNGGGLCDSAAKSNYEYRERTANEEITVTKNSTVSRNTKKEAYGGPGRSKNVLYMVLLQLITIITAAIVCLLMISHAMGDMASIAGVLLIAAALDVLAVKRILGKQDKQAAVDNGQHETINDTKLLAQKEVKKSVSCHDIFRRRSGSPGRREYKAAFRSPDVQRACDTIMVSEIPKDCHPYFEGLGAYIGEKVIINKDKFIIGRLGSMVDHTIQGSTVGKLHAEITNNDGKYYLKDLNSKNGTYINDTRITSNKECEIKDNDKIRFSNYEYIFRQ